MKGKDSLQRILAVVVIVAMLGVMGLPFPVIVFFSGVSYFIWRAVQKSEDEDIRKVFEFYLHANEILKGDQRRWFGFEISQVIDEGERAVHSMIDPPPLAYFALGALYHEAGNNDKAAEHLRLVADEKTGDERNQLSPSPDLRRYVKTLREIEREPATAPQTVAAISSLERARQSRLEELLKACTKAPEAIAEVTAPFSRTIHNTTERLLPVPDEASQINAGVRTLSGNAPPPISDVLRDVYDEKKTA
jgi:hypothetical protein